jgi:hypothetical protein
MGYHRYRSTAGIPSQRSLLIQLALIALCAVGLPSNSTFAGPREQLIPILSHTMESGNLRTMAYLIAGFENRRDRAGLVLRFNNAPGRLSRAAQTSIEHAIRRTAESLALSTDSWTVVLTVPYPDTTIYGDGLSAMVGLSVAAMATGRTVAPGLVMNATITPGGQIGPVGSVPLKIPRRGRGHLRRVLVSKDQAVSAPDEPLTQVQVSPMNSITEAFEELTASSRGGP